MIPLSITGMLTTRQQIQETAILFLLNIALPTVDVVTDLILVQKFFVSGHPNFGTTLLLPFLANYILTWVAWWKMDKKKNVMFLMSVTFGCYPQAKAASVIRWIWADPAKGIQKKRSLMRDISEFEVFAEAVPVVLIMTVLLVKANAYYGAERSDPRNFIDGPLE